MHLSIYPNPNDGSFTISGNFPINEDLKTEITNIYGELVLPTKEMMTANGLELQIDPFLKGVYFLKVYDSDYIFTQKLIVR